MSDSGDRYERPDRNKRPEGQRPGGGNPGGRSDGGGPAKGRPASSGRPAGDRPFRDGARPPRDDRPQHDGARPPRDDRPQRDGARPPRDDRPQRDGARPPRDDRPQRDGARPPRDDRPSRDGAPRTHAQRGGADRPKSDEKRLWTSKGAPARGNFDASERELPEDRDPFGIRSVRPHHDAPAIPDGVVPADLDRVARNELKTLEKENADGVALHLVMAAKLIESDPALAHQHAISAARRAGRIGVVRETLAITAYATGDFALALRELRTYRRITGRDDQLPMMVDSERGVGRPDKALELGRSVSRATLPVPVQVELAIAMSGARLDLGNAEAALSELQIPQLDATKAFTWSPALFDSYAAVLEELGRDEEAETWYSHADAAAEALENAGINEVIEVIEEEGVDYLDSENDAEGDTENNAEGDAAVVTTEEQGDSSSPRTPSED